MSGLFGGGATQSDVPVRYNGIQISASAYGGCVPLIYGRQRLPFNLIWYGAFVSTPNSAGGGGKGGGSEQPSSFTYQASFACAIAEGPSASLINMWSDKALTSLANEGFTLFDGSSGQAAWSYLTTNFPAQAVPYDHTVYVGTPNHALGSSATIPNYTFEMQFAGNAGTAITFTTAPAQNSTSNTLTSAVLANGLWTITFSDDEERLCTVVGTAVNWSGPLTNTGITTAALAGGAYDDDPSDIVFDYLVNTEHGVGFPSSQVGTLVGANSYQAYTRSVGIFLSSMETTQRAAADFLKEILQITNSDAVWSAGKLNIFPYCDAPVAGNGSTYTPNLTPIYSLGDDDYLEPPQGTRKAVADTFNHVRVEFLDRSNTYNTAICEATDLGDVAINGERVMDTLSFHGITSNAVARQVSQLILQTSLYERNTIKFKVRTDYCLLEPMDYIGIQDSVFGYGSVNAVGAVTSAQVFRVTKVTDDDKDTLEIEAMEISGTVRTSALYNWQGAQGFEANYNQTPGSVQAPAFLEAGGALVGAIGGIHLWISVNGPSGSAAWGGCDVWMSFDNATFEQIGTITVPGRYGVTNASLASSTAVPDVTNTLGVTLNNVLSVLNTGSAADAQNNRMLIAVGSGATTEIISYETATLVTAGQYAITTMYRGLYGTQPQTHSSGAQFMRLDASVLQLEIDPGWMGQTLHFKFTSFNMVGKAEELLSAVTSYPYTLSRSNYVYNSVSSSTFIASGSCTVFSPTSGFKQTTGASAWDSSIYSAQSYINGCTAECYPSQTTADIMIGFTVNPTASNSFTNLAYGWDMQSSGALHIFEAGTDIGAFGTYTKTDLLALVYDGKHVAYYHNSKLIRSVPIANQTFAMQISFDTPGGAVYGISFDSMSTAVTPFTLVPMSINVAAAGTRVIANTGAANTWGIRNFQSAESYNNGAELSFSYTPAVSVNAYIGLSNAPATGGSSPGANSETSFYFNNTGGLVECFFGTTLVFTLSGASVSTDVWTLTYDNFMYRWWKNGSIVFQQYAPNEGTLFLFGDFFNTSESFTNLSFGAYGQLSPNPFMASGNADTHDSTASKTSGSTVWDSTVFSINAYPTCHIQFKVTSTAKHVMGGFAKNPQATIGTPSNIDFGWYANGGIWYTVINGAYTTTGLPVALTDTASLTYDGTQVIYRMNGQSLLTPTSPSGANFYALLDFDELGSGVAQLSFGPGTTLDVIGTASLDPNAATTTFVASQPSAGSNGIPTGNAAIGALTGSVSTSPEYDCTVIVTVTAILSQSSGTPALEVGAGYSDDGTLVSMQFGAMQTLTTTPTAYTFQWEFNHTASNRTSTWFAGIAITNPTGGTLSLVLGFFGTSAGSILTCQAEFIKK